MYPFANDLDLSVLEQQALLALADGNTFRDSLILLCTDDSDTSEDESDCLPETCPDTPSGEFTDLYCFPELNYEDVGFISFTDDANGIPVSFSLKNLNHRLIQAIGTFGYMACDDDTNDAAKQNLRETLKILVSIYLMIGDEFLVDSLEWRFSADNLHANVQLDEQLIQLAKAGLLYDAAVTAFVEGFTMQIGESCQVSKLFDESVFNLFHLSVERLSTAMRETSSKRLARKMAPGVESDALKEGRSQLQGSYTATYLATAAAAQRGNEVAEEKTNADLEFLKNGGERLLIALKSLQQQAAIYLGSFNPLGFDDRYIPMQDYNLTLRDRALSALGIAQTSLKDFVAEKRLFDSNLDQLNDAHNSMILNNYRGQLSSLTGIPVDEISIIEGYDNPVETSGDSLYDCDPEDSVFDACVDGAANAWGVLKSKYRQIRVAQIRIDQAEMRKKNALASLKQEEKIFREKNELLKIRQKLHTHRIVEISEYYEDMEGARVKRKVCNRERKNHKTKKKKCHYETSYDVYNEPLDLQAKKEIELQQLLDNYEIVATRMDNSQAHQVQRMHLLHSLAEIEIELGLTIELYNSAEDDFAAAMTQRDNQVFLYKKSMDYKQLTVDEIKDKIVEARIMRSEAALNLARDMKRAVHRSYLAAKALEYKYLKPLENISMDGGETLDIHNLYKAQLPKDVQSFMTSLEQYDTCAWGSVNSRLYEISYSRDILGLTDSYLEEMGATTRAEIEALRQEKLQAHFAVDDWNDLSLEFSTSLNDQIFSKYHKYNVKIWWGNASPPCDPVEAKGVTVLIKTNQVASLDMYVTLTLDGTQTFLNRQNEIVEYVPASEYLNMQVADIDDSLVTVGSFDAFINVDPDSYSMHEWSNSFKGRSIASANWKLLIEDFSYPYDVDWSKVTDIVIYMDTMGNQLP